MSEPKISAALEAFVAEMPTERAPILQLMRAAANALPPGARVLDAGAGDAPYRELFGHCRYTTADWPASIHAGGRSADIAASLENLPVADESFDAVLSTQVLEHVADPFKVASELMRVLVPGGRIWLTVPLLWALHEEPYDFWRYTSHGLRHLLEGTGFRIERLEPRGGYFYALATVLAAAPYWTAPAPRGELLRRILAMALHVSARLVRRLDRLDGQRTLTLGYACVAVRPE